MSSSDSGRHGDEFAIEAAASSGASPRHEGSGASAGPDFLASLSTEVSGKIRVGGTDYAVGLHWNPLEQAESPAKTARSLARSEAINADFFCLPTLSAPSSDSKLKGLIQLSRAAPATQTGLGLKELGHKANMPSLAAHLLQSVYHTLQEGETSWIGLFEADEQFYLVAVREDAILPETDRVFASMDEAVDALHEYLSASSWGRVFAPESLDMEGTEAARLTDLLVGKPQVRLRLVDNKPILVRGGMLLAILGVVVYLSTQGSGLLFPGDDVDLDSVFSPSASQRTKGQTDTSAEIPERPRAPWAGEPSAPAAILSCVGAMADVPLDFPGWAATEITCEKGRVSLHLNRDGGTINWLESFVSDNPRLPGAEVYFTSRQDAVVRTSLDVESRLPDMVDTPTLSEIVDYLVRHVDEAGYSIDVDQRVRLSETESIYFDAASFRLSVPVNPIEFVSLFARVPALTMDRLSFTIQDHAWNIEGKIHEQRAQPLLPPQ